MSIRRGGFQTRPVLFKMRIAASYQYRTPPFCKGGGSVHSQSCLKVMQTFT